MRKKIDSINAVLFDLDGTLADTAPDLVAAVNLLRVQRGMSNLTVEQLRGYISQGAQGLIGAALNIYPGDLEYDALRQQFLYNYEQCLNSNAQLFPGVLEVLEKLNLHHYKWGIVTNKFERYALPLIDCLKINPDVVVCGDTTAYAKPHPASLLHAVKLAKLETQQCLYVGDDLRDIQAGQAAGILTVGVTYGYSEKEIVESWGADFVISAPSEIFDILL